MCTRYFEKLFNSSQPSREDLEVVLEFDQPKVTSDMAERLDRPFTEVEVKNALWKMHPNKSPGSDGFSPFFF